MPGQEGPPKLPGNPAGGPVGGGSSPALSPGGGEGNSAAARSIVHSVVPILHQALNAFPFKSKEYGAISEALRSLRKQFGQEDEAKKAVPAQIQQLMQASQKRGPAAAVPSPGIGGAQKPPGGGMMPGMPQMQGG